MSLQSTIDHIVRRYDDPNFDPYSVNGDAQDEAAETVGMALGRHTGVYSTNDPEEISCPRCGGVGFIAPKGIEKLPELHEVEEFPF